MSEASTHLLLQLSRRRRHLFLARSRFQAAYSSSSSPPSPPSTDEKSDGRRESSDGKDDDGHRSRSRPSHHHPHWLDRRAPSAAEWLDSQTRELWLCGLEERCKRIPELTGHELLLRRVVGERAEALAHKLSRRFPPPPPGESEGEGEGEEGRGKLMPLPTTSRARTHLQAAALVRATGDALLPFFRGDEDKVLEILKDATGGRASGLLTAALRLQARVAPLLAPFVPSFLSGSAPFLPSSGGSKNIAEERLRLLREDHGGAWPGAEVVVVAEGEEEEEEGEEEEEEEEKGSFFASLFPSFLRGGSGPSSSSDLVRLKTTTTTLRVPRCLYFEMMTSEQDDGENDSGSNSSSPPASSPSNSRRPRWLEACCCSVDGVWFEPWKSSSENDGTFLTALAAKKGSEPLVAFRRRRWLGERGGTATACELCVTRVEAFKKSTRETVKQL